MASPPAAGLSVRRLAGLASLAAPDLALAGVHLYAFVGLVWIDDLPATAAIARFFEHWPISEVLALVGSLFLMAIFAPNPDVTRLHRVLAAALIGLPLAGLAHVGGVLQSFWIFLLADSITLYRERPTEGRQASGCAHTLLGGALLLVLSTPFVNVPHAGPRFLRRRFARATSYQVAMMAYGATYFPLRALVTVFADWMRRDIEEGDRMKKETA